LVIYVSIYPIGTLKIDILSIEEEKVESAYYQPVSKKGQKGPHKEDQRAGAAEQPPEEGGLHKGLHFDAQEA
jgi:hypothetical protein